MTAWAQTIAAGAIVMVAGGHLLWQLRRRLRGKRQREAGGCSACDSCKGCTPPR
jgi:hypothetical protein